MLQFAKWDIRQSRLLRFPLTVLHISFLPSLSLSLSLSLQVMIPLCSFVSSQRLLHISLSIVCSVASVKPTRFLPRQSFIDVYKTSLMLEHSSSILLSIIVTVPSKFVATTTATTSAGRRRRFTPLQNGEIK